jgi:hypothetical protein
MDKKELIKRAKSFAWRLGGMVAIAILAFLADNIGLFGLSPQVQVVLGLILGEVTKHLNSQK